MPAQTIDNYAYTGHFSAETAKEVVDKIGIHERRFAPEGMCASDLCQAAAEQLIADLQVDRQEIDVLVFVSQTPDYRMPATGVLLQDRLGLGKHTLAFDLNLGCSAFVYGLSVVYSLMQQQGLRKALLLDGETRSRVYSAKDRQTAFIFGDGGVAALIERNPDYGDSHFSLHSDGSRGGLIKMDAGGYRQPSTPDTLKEKVVDEHGNIRSDEHGYMNGADVFNFVLREIPKDIKETLAYAGVDREAIDYFVFHQANTYMNRYLAKKLKLPAEKVPASIQHFGNTSSVSIPLTMATQLPEVLSSGSGQLLLSGFGVGMSWATAVLNYHQCHVSPLIEI